LYTIFDKNLFLKSDFFEEILKIRLTHAMVRYSMRNQGLEFVPINQEAMLGTNLAFSLIIIRGLKKIGISLTKQEENDYFHFWAVVGFILGVKEDTLPTRLSEASVVDRMIAKRHFGESQAGKELCKALIDSGKDQPDFKKSIIKPEALMVFFLGSKYASMLGLAPKTEMFKKIIFSNLNLFSFVLPTDRELKKQVDFMIKK
jgi:hypothetical protein